MASYSRDLDFFDNKIHLIEDFFIQYASSEIIQTGETSNEVDEIDNSNSPNLQEENKELTKKNEEKEMTIRDLEKRVVDLMELMKANEKRQALSISPKRSSKREPMTFKDDDSEGSSKNTTKNTNIEEENENIKKKLNELKNQNAKLLEEKSAYEKKIREVETEKATLKEENMLLIMELDSPEDKSEINENQDEKIKEIEKYYKEREQQMRIEFRTQFKVELQSRLLEAEDDLTNKIQELEEKETKFKQREEKIVLVEEQMEQMEERMLELRTQYTRGENVQNEYKLKIANLEDQIELLEDENEKYQTEKFNHELTIRKLEQEIEALKMISKVQNHKKESDVQKVQEQQKDRVWIKRENKILKKQNDMLVKQIEELTNHNLSAEAVKKAEVSEEQNSELIRLKLKVEVLEAENKQYQEEWTSNADLIETLTTKIENYEEKNIVE